MLRLFSMEIGIEQLRAMLAECGSVFVFDGWAEHFWRQGLDGYPFRSGALLTSTVADEMRYPGAFVTAAENDSLTLHPNLPDDRAEEFRQRWFEHLDGIVQYAPTTLKLPPWAFPPEQSQ